MVFALHLPPRRRWVRRDVKPVTPMLKCKSILIALIALAGCNQKESNVANRLPLLAPHDDQVAAGWFVESDGAGHHGYQAANIESSSATPQNLPLFTSIDDLRAALRKSGVTNITSIGASYTNSGWRIRGLTAKELIATK